MPFGAYILTVNATDDDKGTNGEILYYLDEKRVKNDDWKRFNLDPKTGVLTLNTKLNINQQSVYSVSFLFNEIIWWKLYIFLKATFSKIKISPKNLIYFKNLIRLI